MSEWPEKEMDELFQRGAEQQEFEYNSTAWEQMQALLDRDKRRRMLWWWMSGTAVVFLAGALWFFTQKEKNGETPVSEKNIPHVLQSPAPKEGYENIPPGQINTSNEEQTTGKGGVGEETASKPVGERNYEASKKQTSGFHEKAAASSDNNQALVSSPVVIDEKINEEAEIPDDPETVDVPPTEKRLASAELAALPQVFPELKYQREPLAISCQDLFDVALGKTTVSAPPAGSFFVSALAATELNSVGMGDFSQLNWKAGIHFEYRYAGRLGIGVGANYIRMDYEAGRDEFVPWEGFWDGKVPPESTLGNCSMIEAPVQLSYYLGGHSTAGFYASAGLTTYFMFREYYHYIYGSPAPSQPIEWETDKNSRYWFGIGTFSIGYRKPLSGRTALHIAPYAQIPLTGVGGGNVKLYSLGTSLRFDFRLK